MRVFPLAIVKHLDVFEDRSDRLRSRRKPMAVHELAFQRRKETLDDGVVPAITPATHAANDSSSAQLLLVVAAGVLTAAIRVMDQSRSRIPTIVVSRVFRTFFSGQPLFSLLVPPKGGPSPCRDRAG